MTIAQGSNKYFGMKSTPLKKITFLEYKITRKSSHTCPRMMTVDSIQNAF